MTKTSDRREPSVEEAKRARVAFLFTGLGSSYARMGAELYAAAPVFRASIDRCARLSADVGLSVVSAVGRGESDAAGDPARVEGPCLFALQAALVDLWRSWGIEPELALGYGAGELAAAYAAGVLSFEDAWQVAVTAAGLAHDRAPLGRLAVVDMGVAAATVQIEAAGFDHEIFIAAVNHESEVVLAGGERAIQAFLPKLQASGAKVTVLGTTRAWHSPKLQSIVQHLKGEIAGLTIGRPELVVASSSLGRVLPRRREDGFDANYLARLWASRVSFGDALQAVLAQDYRIFVEVGPTAGFARIGRTVRPGEDVTWVTSLAPGVSELDSMLAGLRALDQAGAVVHWTSVNDTVKSNREARAATPTTPLVDTLADATLSERIELLRAQIRNQVGRVLGLSEPKPLQLDQPFRDLGLDSMMTVDLWVRIGKDIGRELDPDLAFRYPTINALADFLARESLGGEKWVPAEPRTKPEGDAVAIIGMACRFPGGATNPESFWQLLRSGTDAISEVPRNRWDVRALYDSDASSAGKTITRWGGFLRNVEEFDAAFFSISPREALSMDPQQRLLLEASWEALEDAGHSPHLLRGSDTAVYVGVTYNDYYQRWGSLGDRPERYDLYAATGNTNAMTAGRLSYFLDFRGPSLALDTACSSSLVALHMAVGALRSGETSLAVVGGVNLIMSPETTVNFSRGRMMSPDGRCKTFDARANGYVRAEGCAAIVVKRLSDALRDGDNVMAVVRGTAVNHDGRSNGLTAPNGLAQQALIRSALADARVSANEVDYVEAHGTGTPLGDPTELQALRAAMSEEAPREKALLLGSVKTNIGHTEAAAGLAGLIKIVMSMQHAELPPHLHFQKLNPHIPSAGLPIEIPTTGRAWQRGGRPRVAGISAFGFSGTNAHIILQEPPLPEPRVAEAERPLHLLTLSGRSASAVREGARRLAAHLTSVPQDTLANVAYTANVGRAHFEHRAAVGAATSSELHSKLERLAAGEDVDGVHVGELAAGSEAPRVAFLFSGQASLYPDAGKELYATHPVFRMALDRCATILAPHLDRPLLDILFPPDAAAAELLHETIYAQPALVALEWSLAELWASFGVKPDAVFGHSIGEYSACAVAGVIPIEGVLPLVAKRGALMQRLAEGRMLAVFATLEEVTQRLAATGGRLSVAAVNGPSSIVVAGEVDAAERFAATLAAEGVKSKMLDSKRAFHSPMLEPMLDELERAAQGIEAAQPSIPVVSNLNGTMYWRRRDELPDPAYWRRHAREAVRFADGVRTLVDHGCTVFVEVGPKATLLGPASECVERTDLTWVPTLRKSAGSWSQLLTALGTIYSRGTKVDWAGFDAAYPRRRVRLPTYAFERQSFWIEPPALNRADRDGSEARDGLNHPLLGARNDSPLGTVSYEASVGGRALGYLTDHCVQEKIVFPAAGYIEMAVAAARAASGTTSWILEDMRFVKALVLSEANTRRVQVVFGPSGASGRELQVASRSGDRSSWDGSGWVQHAVGRIRPAADAGSGDVPALDALRARLASTVDSESHYSTMTQMGLQYGPVFRAVTSAYHAPAGGEVLVRIAERVDGLATDDHVLHPAVIDACLQAFSAAGASVVRAQGSFMPISVERVTVAGPVRGASWGYARVRNDGVSPSSRVLLGDCFIYDDNGALVASLTGLRSLRVEQLIVEDAVRDPRELLHEVKWRRSADTPTAKRASGKWVVFCDNAGVGDALADGLKRDGASCVRVRQGEVYEEAASGDFTMRSIHQADYASLWTTISARGSVAGIVHLWGIDSVGSDAVESSNTEHPELTGTQSAMLLAQAVAASSAPTTITFVTAGAQPVGSSVVSALAVSQSAIVGFARAAQWEHPELGCRRIDLPSTGDPARFADALLRELATDDGESEVAVRADGRYVPRLLPRVVNPTSAPFACRPDGSYLVSGAFGGIGREIARWLAERGAKHLVLLGRRGKAADDRGLVDQLTAKGVSVKTAAIDVADAEALRGLLDEVKAEMPELRGVIHAAGVIDDGMLREQTWERFAAVLGPKVAGAWNLHRQTVGTELDFFVVFSSVSALWGAPGQTSYAAANAWLDSLTQARVSAGLPASSIAWGPWSVGMAAGMGAKGERRYRDQGLAMLTPGEGLAALDQLMVDRVPRSAVFAIADRVRLVEHHKDGFATLFAELRAKAAPTVVAAHSTPEAAPATKAPALIRELDSAPAAQRLNVIGDYLRRVVRKQLGFDGNQHLSAQQPFMDMGLDSLMLSNLRRELMSATGKTIPATIGFDYPTLDALVGYIAHDVIGIQTATPAPAVVESPRDDVAALLDRVAALSDSDAEALLAAKLGGS